jgi:hypothetical protein
MNYNNSSGKRLCNVNPFRKLLNRFMKIFGYIPEERFSQASGALSDIKILVTSCVSRNCDLKTRNIASSVLGRILSSAHDVHRKPNWYIHDFEKEIHERYESGTLNACSYDESSKSVAQKLK